MRPRKLVVAALVRDGRAHPDVAAAGRSADAGPVGVSRRQGGAGRVADRRARARGARGAGLRGRRSAAFTRWSFTPTPSSTSTCWSTRRRSPRARRARSRSPRWPGSRRRGCPSSICSPPTTRWPARWRPRLSAAPRRSVRVGRRRLRRAGGGRGRLGRGSARRPGCGRGCAAVTAARSASRSMARAASVASRLQAPHIPGAAQAPRWVCSWLSGGQ